MRNGAASDTRRWAEMGHALFARLFISESYPQVDNLIFRKKIVKIGSMFPIKKGAGPKKTERLFFIATGKQRPYFNSDMNTGRKKSACPICRLKISWPNRLVRFHIRYKPPMVIWACSYCNLVEYQLRRKKDVVDSTRALLVSTYMLKFGIQL